ncbi:LysR substrate-binding domain-containing protein [Pararobbsia silviterrae]|uniref:LysR family transcriptional regulator n=1 Tax=Pararobbsia silviterrae TaxID=1792498 RepID=A0A494Y895_9BURK|nr:LysR substrate-binding domain-containing protein [Pararobbsia silviterrae]RKP58921.1 LysR family transcriptional regulator [Pararobbsia silviterrae]
MELKWLEDFVSLAETRSFSRSAALRHVTQPAFSRRIQALEAWVGTELIDRSTFPTRLTQSGEVFHAQALVILTQAHEARALLRSHEGTASTTIEFAVPHTLALTFFPHWLSGLERDLGCLRTRLRALNVHDAVLMLVEGGVDLVMGYHHPGQPRPLDPARYESVVIGSESVAPYSATHADGTPLFALPGSARAPAPYLSYTPNAYLGRMTQILLSKAATPVHLDKVYETDMAEGLKAMALAGHGVAFLPRSAAADAIEQGRLVSLDTRGDLSLTMEIRLYRDTLAVPTDERRAALVGRLWRHVATSLDTPHAEPT